MRRLLIASIVAALSFAADLCTLAADHGEISAESLDRAHLDADQVRLDRGGLDVAVVITRNRGIGSAQVRIAGNWKGPLYVTFHNFSKLENFAVTDGDKCIEGSLRPAAEYIGTWKDTYCDCSGAKRSLDLLKMKIDGSDIRLKIPLQLLRSKRPNILRLGWIDAYRS